MNNVRVIGCLSMTMSTTVTEKTCTTNSGSQYFSQEENSYIVEWYSSLQNWIWKFIEANDLNM